MDGYASYTGKQKLNATISFFIIIENRFLQNPYKSPSQHLGSQGSASTPIRNPTVHVITNTGRDTGIEIIHRSKFSDSLKALVGTAYEGKANWAVVSSGGGFTDRLTYRCPGYGRGMNAAIPYNDSTPVIQSTLRLQIGAPKRPTAPR